MPEYGIENIRERIIQGHKKLKEPFWHLPDMTGKKLRKFVDKKDLWDMLII